MHVVGSSATSGCVLVLVAGVWAHLIYLVQKYHVNVLCCLQQHCRHAAAGHSLSMWSATTKCDCFLRADQHDEQPANVA